MRTHRDDRADELARKIWELLEQRAAELRRLGVNEGYVRGLWHDTIAHNQVPWTRQHEPKPCG